MPPADLAPEYLEGRALFAATVDTVTNTSGSADVSGSLPNMEEQRGAMPTILGEIVGDGTVSASDYEIVKRFLGTRLPRLAAAQEPTLARRRRPVRCLSAGSALSRRPWWAMSRPCTADEWGWTAAWKRAVTKRIASLFHFGTP